MLSVAHLALATDFSGSYQCYGHDKHDGEYKGAIVTLAQDKTNSDLKHQNGAYHFSLTEPDGITYTGEAAVSGTHMAIYFENTSPSAKDDRGVGIAKITQKKDANGKITTTFHKFYYEPAYQGGNNGYETCVKRT